MNIGPEVEQNGLALVLLQGVGVAELVGEGEVQGGNGGLALLRPVGGLRLLALLGLAGDLGGGGGLGVSPRQGVGQGVHPPGDHQKADDHQ